MKLSLPWPPSTNNAYANVKGRRVKTKAARHYAVDVAAALLELPKADREWARSLPSDARFKVAIAVHPPDRRRRDLANVEKIAVDAIFNWLGHDDSRIDDLHITRGEPVSLGRLDVTIREAGDP